MKYLFPILAILLLPNTSYALSYEKCIVQFIDDSASKNLWLEARGLLITCSCIENKLAQNLEPYACPNHATINDIEIQQRNIIDKTNKE